jgi:hypothetical protein
MKATHFILFAAVFIAACRRDEPVAADSTAASSPAFKAMDLPPVTSVTSQSAGSPRSAAIGIAAGVANESLAEDRADPTPSRSPSDDPLQNIGGATGATLMVIRTGQAFVEVQKLDAAILRIRQLAMQVGGYVANSSLSGGKDQIRQATLEIKIPSAKYDEAVSSLSAIGKVETVNSSAQDVGEEYVDISARVTNAKRLEERLINLLANRTGKLDEVLRVERELARVREEIERYEGRLRYLSSRAAMSTLRVTVHEPAPILGNEPGENPIGADVRLAWENFVGLLAALIASLGILIPLGLLGVGGWIGYRRWMKSRGINSAA